MVTACSITIPMPYASRCLRPLLCLGAGKTACTLLCLINRLVAIIYQYLFACCRKGREPSWLAQEVPKPWPKLSGTTLVMGDASGPNPTHALNLNFYHMYRWMNKASNNSLLQPLSIDIHSLCLALLRTLARTAGVQSCVTLAGVCTNGNAAHDL
jgi:hypothetical protein